MSTFPFVPYATYANNSVPKVTGDALNAEQDLLNALTWPSYLCRPSVKMRCTDGGTIVVQPSPMMIFDAPLNKHTYCAWAETTIDSTSLDVPSGAWPADKWVYVYAYSENRVGKIETSETAPAAIMPAVGVSTASKVFKTGDESRKYLGCFYSDGSSIVRRFRMSDFEYVNLDQVIALWVNTSAAPAWSSYVAIDLSDYVGPDAVETTLAARMVGNVNPFDVVLELSPDSGTVPIVACEVEPNTGGAYTAIKRSLVVMPLLSTTIYGRVTPARDPDVRLEVNGWKE